MKHSTRFGPSSCLVALLIAHTSCVALESTPPYTPPVAQEGPPCDALSDTSEPVYLCETETQGILFVREDGDDGAPGTREAPVKSLGQALALAREQSDKKAILVAGSPSFSGPLSWPRPLDVLGGFDALFQPDQDARPLLSHKGGSVLTFQGMNQPVRLAHLDVTLQASEEAAPIPAVYVGSSTLIHLHDVHVFAPDGVDGKDGTAGQAGQNGAQGTGGGAGTRVAPGMPGTNDACPEAQGGLGGRGGDPAMGETPGQMSVLGVMGGAVEEDGDAGQLGEEGMAGTDASSWSLNMGTWTQATLSSSGQPGAPGQGGGGGGGGDDLAAQGGGGGGGGAGGCGGQGGLSGTSGGWSVAIALENSALELSGDTRIQTGEGGRAGLGGEGGQGGLGDQGGLGALGSGAGQQGGRGGEGAQGGQGGRGGHGQPGHSVGILCIDSSVTREEGVSIMPGLSGEAVDGIQDMGQSVSGCVE